MLVTDDGSVFSFGHPEVGALGHGTDGKFIISTGYVHVRSVFVHVHICTHDGGRMIGGAYIISTGWVYTSTCVHVRAHARALANTRTHACARTHIHTHMRTQPHAGVKDFVRCRPRRKLCSGTCLISRARCAQRERERERGTHTHTHTQTDTHTHTYSRTHVRTHAHTHTHTRCRHRSLYI